MLDSLLDAIERLRGDALVMHVGEKPYVVTTSEATDQLRGPLAWGQVELPSPVLTLETLNETLARILSIDQRAALDAYGAIKFDVASTASQRFAVVAARGGGDVWLEIRRHKATSTEPTAETVSVAEPAAAGVAEIKAEAEGMAIEEEIALADPEFPSEQLLHHDMEWSDDVMTEAELNDLLRASAVVVDAEEAIAPQGVRQGSIKDAGTPEKVASTASQESDPGLVITSAPPTKVTAPPPGAAPESPVAPVAERERVPEIGRSRPALVVPLSRPARSEPPTEIRGGLSALERVLRIGAERGAAAVYVVAQSQPMVRVDDEISALEGEPVFTVASVERLTAAIAPHTRDDSTPPAQEWTIDVQELGRVRCTSFRDHRGPGLIFRMIPQRAITVDQAALPTEIQALCSEADGLVLVTGGRGTGKSTLLTSLVDLINRTRSDHVITIESQIEFVHANKRAFISQREVRGDADAMANAVRAAGREDPDVVVIEELRTPDIVTLALEIAQAGRLVLASVQAPSTVSAIERIIEMFPPERREKAQSLLSGTLRGIVSQVLLRRLKGGVVVAREVLLNTPAVAELILEGKIFQLSSALENGRSAGMMSLAESLASLVREGTVHPSHAYRKAPNREQFLAILRRDGVDTSITERFA